MSATAAEVLSSLGFSISPPKKQPKKKGQDDEEYILTLAPFTKAPKINFGELKVENTVEKNLLIINPQEFRVELNIKNNELNIDNFQLALEKGENVNLKLKWTPVKPGNYKFAISFEVLHSARLKFLVHAFGVCIKPEVKKPAVRKPLTVLQPLKPPATKKLTSTTSSSSLMPTQDKKLNETILINKKSTTNNLKIEVTKANKVIKKSTSLYTGLKYNEDSVGPEDPQVLEVDENEPEMNNLTQYHLRVDETINTIARTPKFNSIKSCLDIYNSKTPVAPELEDIDNLVKKIEKNAEDAYENMTKEMVHVNENVLKTPTFASPKKCESKSDSQLLKTPTYEMESKNGLEGLYNNRESFIGKYEYRYEDKSGEFETEVKKLADKLIFTPTLSLISPDGPQMSSYINESTNLNNMDQTMLHTNEFRNSTMYNAFSQSNFDKTTTKDFTTYQQFHTQTHTIVSENHLTEYREDTVESYWVKRETVITNSNSVETDSELNKLNEQKAHLAQVQTTAAIKIQSYWRALTARRQVQLLKAAQKRQARLEHCVLLIQTQWRRLAAMRHLTALKQARAQSRSALVIQSAWRRFKATQRLKLLSQTALRLQTAWRAYQARNEYKRRLQNRQRETLERERLHKSALLVQSAWRRYRAISTLQRLKRQFLENKSATRIQCVWKMHRAVLELNRLRRLALENRSALIIQSTWRRYVAMRMLNQLKLASLRNKSALIVQSAWRRHQAIKELNTLRARRTLTLTIESAVKIQCYWRRYRARRQLNRLREHRSAVRIQCCWRRYRARRELNELRRNHSAVLIQTAWRRYVAIRTLVGLKKQREHQIWQRNELMRLNYYATRIQSAWRGYYIRKHTTNNLSSIRSRLSTYVYNGQSSKTTSTLGARIKNSLSILTGSEVSIQQIIISLNELDIVTRLSPECCLMFTNENAIEILYNFIFNCNRSVPHMDLIKLCLQVLINLAKYAQTVEFVLKPNKSLKILLNLLQAYQTSNATIFMQVCVLFILLAQQDYLRQYLLSDETFRKKLQTIYEALERKSTLSKQHSISTTPHTPQLKAKEHLNQTVNLNTSAFATCVSTPSKKKANTISFNLAPDWSLRKTEIVNLVEPFGALKFLLTSLSD